MYNVILSRVRFFSSWTPRVQKSWADEYILYIGAENFEMSCRLLENLCTLGRTIQCAAVAVNIVKCYNRYWNHLLYFCLKNVLLMCLC